MDNVVRLMPALREEEPPKPCPGQAGAISEQSLEDLCPGSWCSRCPARDSCPIAECILTDTPVTDSEALAKHWLDNLCDNLNAPRSNCEAYKSLIRDALARYGLSILISNLYANSLDITRADQAIDEVAHEAKHHLRQGYAFDVEQVIKRNKELQMQNEELRAESARLREKLQATRRKYRR